MNTTQNAVSEKQNSGTPNLSLYEMYTRLYGRQIPAHQLIEKKKFLKLPYHERLRLAGAKIMLLKHNSSLLKCYPINTPISLPEIQNKTIQSYDDFSTGIWLHGKDDNCIEIYDKLIYVYPFEYQIIFESF